jgi:hypothetical protein
MLRTLQSTWKRSPLLPSTSHEAWDFYTDRASSSHMAAATDECPRLPRTSPTAQKYPHTSPRLSSNVRKTVGEVGDATAAPMQLGRSSHKSQGKPTLIHCHSVQRPFSCVYGLITPRSQHVAGLSAASFHSLVRSEAQSSTRLSPNSTVSSTFIQPTEVTQL